MRLGYAAGQVLAHEASVGTRPTVLIGKDTRLSGYMLEAALEAEQLPALVDMGAKLTSSALDEKWWINTGDIEIGRAHV